MTVIPGTLRHVGRFALLLSLLFCAQTGFAFEAQDNDAFFLGSGSANIQVKDSDDLLAGANMFGGIRIGLFWTVFAELGYGASEYQDEVLIDGVRKKIEFRTTGGHLGLGLLIPIRKIALGAKYVVNPDNKWEQKQINVPTHTKDFADSGTIDFDSYYLFARLGRWFEIGARRDHITKSDSLLTNSFGPYIALNIPLN